MAKRNAPAPDEEKGPKTAPKEGYTVLARRYRPQQFRDLVGQEHVARALINALESNRVAHAYLFTGARGVGKTSAARILAKALNCAKGPTPTPCDECDTCRSIAVGEDVDVLEIDGASNRGIDEVRELRSNARSRPTARSRYKIYIIDEVHMLTREAFNALLKTLEEPPPHVKFIFATTEVQRIPITILSRCQRFDFAGIGTPKIVERLRQVVAAEGAHADDDALELVARRAGGSMRDAQSLLDQLLAFGGEPGAGRLAADDVHRLLGTAHDDRIAELAGAVLGHDVPKALDVVRQAADEGLHLGELVDQLIDYWRDLMVVASAGPDGRELSVPSRHREALAGQAKALSLDTILAGLDILSATKARLRGSGHGRVLVEMAVVRLGRLDDLVSLSQLAQWIGQGNGVQGVPVKRQPSTAATIASVALPRTGNLAESKPVIEGSKKKVSDPPQPYPSKELTEESLPHVWQEVMTQLPQILSNHLKKAKLPAIFGPNTLVLRFGSEYNDDQYCQSASSLARIEEALKQVTGRTWQLRVESVSNEAAASHVQAAERDNSPSRYRRQRAEAIQDPLIKRAVDVLGAQIVHVDEGFGAAPPAIPERPEADDTEES